MVPPTIIPFLLVLLAALSISIGSALIKLTLHRISLLRLGFYRSFFGLLVTAPVVIAAQEWQGWQPNWLGIGPVLLSSGLFLIGTLTYMKAVQTANLSKAVPIIQSHPMFAFLIGATILGERVTLPLLVGALLIIGGIIGLGLGSLDRAEVAINRSLYWALICSLILGLSTVVMKWTLRFIPPLSLNLVLLFVALPFFYWVLRLRKIRPWTGVERRDMILAALAAICTYGLGQMLFLAALEDLPVVVATPIFSTTLLFSVVFGRLFFQERLSGVQLRGSLLILVGVSATAWR